MASLALGVAGAVSTLETALQNARQATSDADRVSAFDSAESALASIKSFATLAFEQAARDENA
jgi:hypothetical protein